MIDLSNLRHNFTQLLRGANHTEIETMLACLHDELSVRVPIAARHIGTALDAMIDARQRWNRHTLDSRPASPGTPRPDLGGAGSKD